MGHNRSQLLNHLPLFLYTRYIEVSNCSFRQHRKETADSAYGAVMAGPSYPSSTLVATFPFSQAR
jgi:hypothetical protein